MDQTRLLKALEPYGAALRENGATALFVFGSRAVGTERSDSDLDLFIDYDAKAKVPNLFRLMQIEEQVSRALGVPVTITTREALHPLMKDRIEREAIRFCNGQRSGYRHSRLPGRNPILACECWRHDARILRERSDGAPGRRVCDSDDIGSRTGYSRGMLADFPALPWTQIKAIGNRLRHEYFRIDDAILWEIITTETHALKDALETMLLRHAGIQH